MQIFKMWLARSILAIMAMIGIYGITIVDPAVLWAILLVFGILFVIFVFFWAVDHCVNGKDYFD